MNADSGVPAPINITTGEQLGRIEIAVRSDPNVFVQVQSIAWNAGCGNTNGCQIGVSSSTDGDSWTFMGLSGGCP